MSITFNAFEIFEIAEQIERNGQAFYSRAAESVSGEKIKKLFLDLAAMEVEHEKTFTAMRQGLSDEAREMLVFDPENEAALYLQAIADGHVFDLGKQDVDFSGKDVSDILSDAIAAEKDSIAFYAGFRDIVPQKAGRDKVDAIIREEMMHVSILSGKKTNCKKNINKRSFKMQKYICLMCGYVYDPAIGDPDNGVAAGTAFADVPEDWLCPECAVGKDEFEEYNG